MAYKIPSEAWKVIEIKIRRYPENKAIYDSAVEALIHSAPENDGMPHGTGTSNPTERIAVKLADDPKLRRIKQEIDAVEAAYNSLRPEYQKVIRVRFWSYRHQNMPYFDMEPYTNYRERQMQKIVSRFIRKVGKNIGEL